MKADPHALDAEEGLLGALMLSSGLLSGVLAETNLAPDHFYRDAHRLIFRTMAAMYDQGTPIDEVSVAAELESRSLLGQAGGRARLSELTSTVGAIGHAMYYAGLVLEKAEWRIRRDAGQTILEACAAEDDDLLAAGEELLNRDLVHASSDFDPDQLADIGFNLVNGNAAECFPWPLERLNQFTAGGIRRGELVVVAGHTSHGKSVFVDQLLENCAKRAKVRLYMNEMSLDERVARTLNRRTGIPYHRLVQGKVSEEQSRKILAELNRGLPYGVTFVPGWSANQISHHIRRSRWDVCAVDILHEIDYEDERDLSRMASVFARTAKQANCALIVTAHLSEKRVGSAIRPRPTLGDIRGSGQIKNAADSVCFVYRQQDKETAEPIDKGAVILAKVRNGQVGSVPVHFNGQRLRFEPA